MPLILAITSESFFEKFNLRGFPKNTYPLKALIASSAYSSSWNTTNAWPLILMFLFAWTSTTSP
jgi:hypothetical protein